MKQIKDMNDDELIQAYEDQIRRQGGKLDVTTVGYNIDELDDEIVRRGLTVPTYKS